MANLSFWVVSSSRDDSEPSNTRGPHPSLVKEGAALKCVLRRFTACEPEL